MNKESALIWTRWIVTLPCAVFASIGAYLILHYCNLFFSDPGSWNLRYFEPFECSFISGLVYMYAGINMAPSNKNKTSLILLVLLILTLTIIIILDISYKQYSRSSKLAVMIIGSIIGYFIFKDHREEYMLKKKKSKIKAAAISNSQAD